MKEVQGVLEVLTFHLEEEASSSLEEGHQVAPLVEEEGEEVGAFP